jgi:TolB-like protein
MHKSLNPISSCLVALALVVAAAGLARAQYATTRVLTIPAFTNLSRDPAHDWLNEALADMLTTDIASPRRVRVVSRLELKKLLAEQRFAVSDLAAPEQRLQLGNMVGASVILTGSYTVVGDAIRIDAKLFDVERGEALAAATVEGALGQVFVLEKKLALRVFEGFGVTLSDEDRIALLQFDARNVDALADNYRGVLALDQKDVKNAQAYFEKAAAADPFYRGARQNLDGLRQAVRGPSLFAGAMDELTRKQRQLDGMLAAIADFRKELWSLELDGGPKPVTDTNKPGRVTVEVRVKWGLRDAVIQRFVEAMTGMQAGDGELCVPTYTFGQPRLNCFRVHADNVERLNKALSGGENNRDYLMRCATVEVSSATRKLMNQRACLFVGHEGGWGCHDPFARRSEEGFPFYCALNGPKLQVKAYVKGRWDNNRLVVQFPDVPVAALNEMTGIELVLD